MGGEFPSREGKRPWYEIEPAEAREMRLPSPSVWGPVTSEGLECAWPWEPQQLIGAPLGQYHCRYCGEMVLAGMRHLDYWEGWEG